MDQKPKPVIRYDGQPLVDFPRSAGYYDGESRANKLVIQALPAIDGEATEECFQDFRSDQRKALTRVALDLELRPEDATVVWQIPPRALNANHLIKPYDYVMGWDSQLDDSNLVGMLDSAKSPTQDYADYEHRYQEQALGDYFGAVFMVSKGKVPRSQTSEGFIGLRGMQLSEMSRLVHNTDEMLSSGGIRYEVPSLRGLWEALVVADNYSDYNSGKSPRNLLLEELTQMTPGGIFAGSSLCGPGEERADYVIRTDLLRKVGHTCECLTMFKSDYGSYDLAKAPTGVVRFIFPDAANAPDGSYSEKPKPRDASGRFVKKSQS
jgi:hypothetical protein